MQLLYMIRIANLDNSLEYIGVCGSNIVGIPLLITIKYGSASGWTSMLMHNLHKPIDFNEQCIILCCWRDQDQLSVFPGDNSWSQEVLTMGPLRSANHWEPYQVRRGWTKWITHLKKNYIFSSKLFYAQSTCPKLMLHFCIKAFIYKNTHLQNCICKIIWQTGKHYLCLGLCVQWWLLW